MQAHTEENKTAVPQSRLHIPELDGIRGLAILAVLVFHFRMLIPQQSGLEYAWLKSLAPLWCGVNLFFVLSGFLITGILLDAKGSTNYFTSFYWRRLLRIFPLYYATLLVVAWIASRSSNPEITNFNTEQIWFWTYLSNWRAASQSISDFLPHLWSLAVEEQFYLVWPLAVLLCSRKILIQVCAFLLFASLAYRAGAVALDATRYAYFATPSRAGELACGALGALAMRDVSLRTWVDRHTRALAVVGAVITLVALLAGGGFEANKGIVDTLGVFGLSVLFGLLVLRAPGLHGLRSPAMVWLGKYSYGIYMLHPFVQKTESPLLRGFLGQQPLALRVPLTAVAMGAGILVSCAAAWASYHVLEAPFLRMKRFVRGV